MKTPVYLVHATRGRMRLRFPTKRGDPDFFAAAAQRLSELVGVESVSFSPMTGTLVLNYAGDPKVLLIKGLGASDWELQPAPTVNSGWGRFLADAMASDQGRVACFWTLSALAIWQLRRGAILPAATSLAAHAWKFR